MYEEVKIHSIDVISKVYKIYDTAHLNKIMDTWEREKAYFLEKWGGPSIKICENYNGSLNNDELLNILNQCKEKIYNKIDEASRIKDQIWTYFGKMLIEDFFNNITSKDYVIEDVYIRRGMKVGKSIKFFFEQYYGPNITEKNKENLSKIQMIMSTAQQKNKVSGDLYLSVHPLDFLTMSTNNHKWTSCHAINHAYSAGNFAYIQDPVTCVAYLVTPGKERVQLNKLPEGCLWNDKSWRMLFFLSEDRNFAASGRHYPYAVPELEKKVALSLIPVYGWHSDTPSLREAPLYDKLVSSVENVSPFHLSENERLVCTNCELFKIGDIILTNEQRPSEEPRFYCDILWSCVYTPRFYFKGYPDKPTISIGKYGCGCLCCGKDASCQSYGLPFCKDCFDDLTKTGVSEDWWTCSCCGYQAHDDECKKMEDRHGRVYCPDCYRDEDEEDDY